jgi:tRNA dimethylallyltransferase
MINNHGLEYMYKRLQRVDPTWAKRITPKDKQRIMRGLEVYTMTGKPLSRLIGKRKKIARFLPCYIGLNIPRELLYDRINERFDKMIKQGLISEVESLLARGFDPQASALKTIGYKEIVEYLRGALTLDEAIDRAKRQTRNFAKRQITWFNKIPGLKWCSPEDPGLIDSIIRQSAT